MFYVRGSHMGKQKLTEITEHQKKTLKVIHSLIQSTSLPPTVKELSIVLGISHASVHEQISQLVRKGYLKKSPRKARSLVVVMMPE